ncbi:sugar transferase [bacterium]|nr:sugar transferase [bacterium]
MKVLHVNAQSLKPSNVALKNAESRLSSEELKLLDSYKQQYNYSKTKPVQWGLKRAMDYSLGFVGLIISLPINLLAALAIKLDSKGPILFKQSRVGKNGKPFIIYKFRTMNNDASKEYFRLSSADDPRVTKVGRKLRKYSIDEFPQFLNILKGNMSIIGPRPFSINEHDRCNINNEFIKRYVVRPGAKLPYNSMKGADINDKIQVEKDYVENWNLKKDIKILFSIISDIFKGNNY